MTIWSRFQQLVDRVLGEDERSLELREEELRLAAAALLINAASVDGKFEPEERKKLKALLEGRFGLAGDGLKQVLGEAEAWEQESVDLYSFTSVLARELDQDGRKRIVEMLWEVVMADGVVHEFESNLVWRTAELLGVSTRDRVTLRQQVAARVGCGSDS
jgi:uncharacterized tellurite resistance protein B-like protein